MSKMFAYRKIKRGSIIKVRDYLPANKGSKYKIPKEFNLESDVPEQSFTEEVLCCLPKDGNKWQIPRQELENRLDLRSYHVCSVDPPGCTDIDDALHYKDLGGNICEVGVHIADVSYFVRPETALDNEAANRGTTVYLCDRRIDMIPDLLSSNLCSLIQHQDRLAFSAIWKLTKDTGDILEVKFARSIINSKASLTYEKAQEMIDDASQNGVLHKNLRGLNALAKKLKARRLERGALVLARADEIRFIEVESETFDCDSSLEIQHKRLVETNSMVEEFMLLANISVANKLLESYPQQALLRRHPKPSKNNFQDLIDSARAKGFDIRPDDGKSLSNSLDKAQLESDYYFNLMLRMIATRCMTPAAYFCSGCYDPKTVSFSHFGLAADLYTHFTSPIRRYADLLVHRLLACAIGSETLDKNMQNKENIQMLCDQINYRHRMAQLASRASTKHHTILYMKSKQELTEDAYVFSIRQNDIQILIPRLAFQYTYPLKPNYAWIYDVDERTQRNIQHDVVLRQFDNLKVHISFSSREDLTLANRLQVKIIHPPLDVNVLSETIDDNVDIRISDTTTAVESGKESSGGRKHTFGDEPYGDMKKKIRLGLDDKRAAKPVIVVPGDSLDKYITQDTTILGPGLMRIYDMVVATKSGILKWRNNHLFWVDSHQKRYVAARGECVIGVVRSKGSLHARVDINSAELATLSLLAFEGANKRNKPNLSVGDLVYAKVLSASKHVETELVCVNSNGKRDGLGLIGDKGGTMISLSIDSVRVLLSPMCDLLEKLGQVHRYEIALGMNGRVWINSSDTSVIVQVIEVLRKFDQACEDHTGLS